MTAPRLTGRALYALYAARFAWRRPLPWRALHGYERRAWSSLAADLAECPALAAGRRITDTPVGEGRGTLAPGAGP